MLLTRSCVAYRFFAGTLIHFIQIFANIVPFSEDDVDDAYIGQNSNVYASYKKIVSTRNLKSFDLSV